MLIVEVLADEVGGRHRQHAEDLSPITLLKIGERGTEGEPGEEFGNRLATVEIGGDPVEHLGKVGADPAQATIELQVARSRLGAVGSLGEGGGRLLGIAPEGDRRAVGWMRREDARLWLNEAYRAAEAKVACDTWTEASHRVGKHRRTYAIDRRGECHAAEFAPRLNDDHAHPCAREVARSNEAVVPAAEHHHVGRGGAGRSLLRHAAHSPTCALLFKISSAARRPGAAMIPPPGWADELASQ